MSKWGGVTLLSQVQPIVTNPLILRILPLGFYSYK